MAVESNLLSVAFKNCNLFSSYYVFSQPGIEEGSFSKQKASQDFEEAGEQSCIAKRKKSGINRTTKTSPSVIYSRYLWKDLII